MDHILNEFGQPIGLPLPDWTPPPPPPREPMAGRFSHLEPLDPAAHADTLYAEYAAEVDDRGWTYLPYGPFRTPESFQAWVVAVHAGDDPLFFAILDRVGGKPVGVASYLQIAPAGGSIEVGHLNYSPRLKRSPIATEAMYLMMERAFRLGYRRYEWKCDALNAASRAAARRLGLSYEGTFRQAKVYKGRNRDTAWYAAIDAEWPALRGAFETWLAPGNFDPQGRQRSRLSDLTGSLVRVRG